MEESLLEKLTERSQAFYKPVNVNCVTYAIDESISLTSMLIILNQSGNYGLFLWAGSR